MWASHCGGLYVCGVQALGTRASVAVVQGLSSCCAEANLPQALGDLPGQGIKPVSAALVGESLTAGPPGK